MHTARGQHTLAAMAVLAVLGTQATLANAKCLSKRDFQDTLLLADYVRGSSSRGELHNHPPSHHHHSQVGEGTEGNEPASPTVMQVLRNNPQDFSIMLTILEAHPEFEQLLSDTQSHVSLVAVPDYFLGRNGVPETYNDGWFYNEMHAKAAKKQRKMTFWESVSSVVSSVFSFGTSGADVAGDGGHSVEGIPPPGSRNYNVAEAETLFANAFLAFAGENPQCVELDDGEETKNMNELERVPDWLITAAIKYHIIPGGNINSIKALYPEREEGEFDDRVTILGEDEDEDEGDDGDNDGDDDDGGDDDEEPPHHKPPHHKPPHHHPPHHRPGGPHDPDHPPHHHHPHHPPHHHHPHHPPHHRHPPHHGKRPHHPPPHPPPPDHGGDDGGDTPPSPPSPLPPVTVNKFNTLLELPSNPELEVIDEELGVLEQDDGVRLTLQMSVSYGRPPHRHPHHHHPHTPPPPPPHHHDDNDHKKFHHRKPHHNPGHSHHKKNGHPHHPPPPPPPPHEGHGRHHRRPGPPPPPPPHDGGGRHHHPGPPPPPPPPHHGHDHHHGHHHGPPKPPHAIILNGAREIIGEPIDTSNGVLVIVDGVIPLFTKPLFEEVGNDEFEDAVDENEDEEVKNPYKNPHVHGHRYRGVGIVDE